MPRSKATRIWMCQYCQEPFEKVNTGHIFLYCSRRCMALHVKPSSVNLIPDGQPMSKRTEARRKKSLGLSKVALDYPINTDFFLSWSADLAWLIGLIWSDGNLSKNTIEICSKDIQLIDLVMSLIGGHYALKNNGKHTRVIFTSKVIADFLRSIGLTGKKSLTITWPQIPEEYYGDFMRGLIDGDGSVLLIQTRHGQQVPDLAVNLVTASPFLRDGAMEWFKKHDITFSVVEYKYDNPLWSIRVRRQESLRNLYHLLYTHADVVCLHRKYANYYQWMTTPRAKAGRKKVTAES